MNLYQRTEQWWRRWLPRRPQRLLEVSARTCPRCSWLVPASRWDEHQAEHKAEARREYEAASSDASPRAIVTGRIVTCAADACDWRGPEQMALLHWREAHGDATPTADACERWLRGGAA